MELLQLKLPFTIEYAHITDAACACCTAARNEGMSISCSTRLSTMTLSADVLRYVSWLYASKCLTWDITSWLCTPSISATSSDEFRNGSSDSASKDRPHRGSLSMFTVGPRLTLTPLPKSSA